MKSHARLQLELLLLLLLLIGCRPVSGGDSTSISRPRTTGVAATTGGGRGRAVGVGADRCDLSGDWVIYTRVGGGGSIPASTAESVHVAQAPDGSFTVTATATNQLFGSGQVQLDRHVALQLAHKLVPAPPPPPPAGCSTRASCNATCPKAHPMATCPGGPVYYCCGVCDGTYACPTNKGLAACACNAPPPPPVTSMSGTVQPACNIGERGHSACRRIANWLLRVPDRATPPRSAVELRRAGQHELRRPLAACHVEEGEPGGRRGARGVLLAL